MSSTKARKIVRRTLVGGSLVVVIALLLWITDRSATGAPIFFAGTAIGLAALVETSRMGTIGLLNALPALLSTGVAIVALVNAQMEAWPIVRDYRTIDPAAAHLAPSPWLWYAAALLVGLASYGTLRVLKRATGSDLVARYVTYLAIGAIVVYGLNDHVSEPSSLRSAAWALGGLALVTSVIVAREHEGLRRLAIVAGLGLWIAPPLLLLWPHWAQWGTRGLIALLVLSKIGDTAGYYVGNAIGKSHPFPKISPGKTTAGCVGSLVAAMTVAAIFQATHILPESRYGLVGALAAGAVLNIAAQAGDLAESWVKRRAGVKDSSRLFDVSGGLLDQIDSLLFSVPAALLTWPILFVLH